MLIAGWSDARQQMEAYCVYSYAESGTGARPFEMQPVDPGMVSPAVSLGGLDLEAASFLTEVGKRQREHWPHSVGGFLQSTVIRRDVIETQIVERCPDFVGDRLSVPA